MLASAVFISILLVHCCIHTVLATGRQSRIEFIDLNRPTTSSPFNEGNGRPVEAVTGTPVKFATDNWATAVNGNQPQNAVPVRGHARFRSSVFRSSEQSIPKPHAHAVLDPSPSRPPGLHVVFPATEQAPVLDRHLANILAINSYRGIANPVPALAFSSPGTRSNLLRYSNALTKLPQAEFYYHVGASVDHEQKQVGYVHLYQPMAAEHFQYIFPGSVVNDWNTLTPVLALRIRTPQPYPWHFGRLEIAGVELIHHPDFKSLKAQFWPLYLLPRGSLRQILDQIAEGRLGV